MSAYIVHAAPESRAFSVTAEGGAVREPYTCLMSVYEKEVPERLDCAIASIMGQTVAPAEFLIVADGPLGDGLTSVIESWRARHPSVFNVVRLERNRGLWKALQVGVERSANDLILRMDSDDWSSPQRARAQLDYLARHPEVSLCGTFVEEFVGDLSNVVSKVVLPADHDDIVAFSKTRCPFRHPAMLYRRSAVMAAGSYREMPMMEDYDLVMRMLASGARTHNIDRFLVKMRVDDSFYRRRGGLRYAGQVLRFRFACLRRGDVSLSDFLIGAGGQVVVCLMPNALRAAFYRRFLRK